MKIVLAMIPMLLLADAAMAVPRHYHDRPATGGLRLDGSRWRIVRVDGQPVRSARIAELRFTADRVSGNAGCNSFGGSYQVVGRKLTTSQIISTKMACVDPGGKPVTGERQVMAVLTGPARVAMKRDTMTLTATTGSLELHRAVD